MSTFNVCRIDEVKAGRGKKVIVDGEEIVLFNVDGHIYAVLNICPHQKFQKLHEGLFEHGVVTCPMHGWAYDVKTGISTNASGRLKTFPVEVRDGNVFINMEEE